MRYASTSWAEIGAADERSAALPPLRRAAPMRFLLWLIVLVAAAVGFTLAARTYPGYVLLVLPPYRLELSVSLAVVLLALGFAIGYGVLRAAAATLGLPRKVQAYHRQRRQKQAWTLLAEACGALLEGRYRKAEKAAARNLTSEIHPTLAAVLAARAAHVLREYERRDRYLTQAESAAPEQESLLLMTRAELLADQRRPAEALETLQALQRRSTAVLRLELRLRQNLEHWERVPPLVTQLEKRGVLLPLQAEGMRRQAHVELLRRCGQHLPSLQNTWDRVPAAEKLNPRIAAVAAKGFSDAGDKNTAGRIIEAALAPHWDRELILLYAECDAAEHRPRIERAERWLADHPRDGGLLLTLGRLCTAAELWGKARNYLEASLAVENSYATHLALARMLERLEDPQGAERHYRESLQLAVGQLEEISGGRRRAAY